MAKGWSFGGLVAALKNGAFLNVGTTTNTLAAGDDTRIVNALQRGQNLADLLDKAVSRNNLGLGTAATRQVGANVFGYLPPIEAFGGLMATNGWLKVPIIATSGGAVTVIIQWGTVPTPPNSAQNYNLNIAFPHAGLWAAGSRGAPGSNAGMGATLGNNQIYIQNYAPSGVAENCNWIAIGY